MACETHAINVLIINVVIYACPGVLDPRVRYSSVGDARRGRDAEAIGNARRGFHKERLRRDQEQVGALKVRRVQ